VAQYWLQIVAHFALPFNNRKAKSIEPTKNSLKTKPVCSKASSIYRQD